MGNECKNRPRTIFDFNHNFIDYGQIFKIQSVAYSLRPLIFKNMFKTSGGNQENCGQT